MMKNILLMREILVALFVLSFVSAAFAQTVAVDADSTGNTATSLGATDSCISASVGSTVNVDLVISNAADVFAVSTHVTYPSAILGINSKNSNMFLGSTMDFSDGLPDNDGTYLAFIADTNGAGHNGAGTVIRFNFTVKSSGNGYINLNETALLNSNNEPIGDTNGDTYYDGTVTNGQILVGQSCSGATTTTSTTTTSTTVAGATTTTSTTVATTTTTLPVTNLSVFTHNFTNIVPGTTSFATVTNTNIQIREISIQTKNTVNNVSVTISKLSGKPSSVTTPASKAYQYFQVDHSNMNNSDINMAFIKFTVSKSWLTDNNVPASSIALQRYSGGSWSKLVTTQTSETSSDVEYRTESPGLSVFVITGEATATTTTTVAPSGGETSQTTNTVATTPNQEGGGSADATSTTIEVAKPSNEAKPTDILIFFVLIVVVVIIVAILYLRRTGRTSASAAITPPGSV